MNAFIGITAAVIGMAGIALLGISSYFYKLAVGRTPKAFVFNKEEQDPAIPEARASEKQADRAWLKQQQIEDVWVNSSDGLRLHASFIEAQSPSKRTAVLIHGYSAQGLDMAAYARIYHEKLGMNVLMPDNRGHGQSDGHYIGFGWHDRLDIIEWIHYVNRRTGRGTEIILHGVSMGGAAVLMASGEKLPSSVKAVVSDCAYSSAEEELKYQLKSMYKLPSFPFLPLTSWLTRFRAGYSFPEASALNQVKHAKVPILFIHGTEDTFVPTAMARPLYEACCTEKELWLVPGAGHGLSLSTDPQGYAERVVQFVQRFLDKKHNRTSAS